VPVPEGVDGPFGSFGHGHALEETLPVKKRRRYMTKAVGDGNLGPEWVSGERVFPSFRRIHWGPCLEFGFPANATFNDYFASLMKQTELLNQRKTTREELRQHVNKNFKKEQDLLDLVEAAGDEVQMAKCLQRQFSDAGLVMSNEGNRPMTAEDISTMVRNKLAKKDRN